MTVSTTNKQFVQELGADVIIDYKSQNFEDLLNNYDAVFDTIGSQTYRRSFNVLKKGGIIVSMLEQPNTDLIYKHDVKPYFDLYNLTSIG
jgi:NADPH:quinone reductase-like Zn-dependent oxidoreductase